MSRWIPPQGWWPRLIAWCCRHRMRWAKEYAAERIVQEREDDQMQAVLSRCWATGKPVYATTDEDGNLVFREWEEQ